jgi:hypothetical protein
MEQLGEEPDKAVLVSRLSALARASREANPGWTFTGFTGSPSRLSEDERLEQALARLATVSAPALLAVIDEAARPDNVFSGGPAGTTGLFGTNIADYILRASFRQISPDDLLPVETMEASLLDPVAFREILLTYRRVNALESVRSALGLAPSESLAVDAVAAYGFDDVSFVLHVASANEALQWSLAAPALRKITGYAGVGAYSDAAEKIHSMTAPFARFLLKQRPGLDELTGMMERDTFARFGISPSRFPQAAYRLGLSRLSASAPGVVTRHESARQGRPVKSRKLPSRVAGWENDSHVFLVPWRDTARIKSEAGALTRRVGAPSHQHIVTRRRARLLLWSERVLPVLIAATLVALVLWIHQWSGTPVMMNWDWILREPKVAVLMWLIPLASGLVVGLGLASLPTFRERSFDEFAAEVGSLQATGDVRRDRAFVRALRELRPEAFTARRRCPVPSTFTIATETNGIVVYGRGSGPERVAAFHWLNIVAVTRLAPSNEDIARRGERRYRFAIEVRHGDTTVSLPCVIQRAKVDYAAESSAWERPFPVFVSSLTNGRSRWTIAERADPGELDRRFRMTQPDASLAGTPYEAQVAEYEQGSQPSGKSPSRVRYRARLRTNIPLMFVIVLVGVFGPSAAFTFLI